MTQPPWHRTKIVCTLGPATDRPGVLAGLIGAGLDIARFNMSHGDPTDHARRIQQLRQLARQTGQPVAVLIDLPGPKFRLGNLPEDSRELRRGATVLIWTGGLLFLLQAAHFGRFNALYGALGSIVAFLLWIYLSSCVGVFGVCFCAAQTEVRENANDHPEKHPE